MSLRVRDASLFVQPLRLRTPFSFGAVTLEELPHVFLRLETTVDGTDSVGVASDHALPGWFEKDPEKSVRDDVANDLLVIEHAASAAEGTAAETPFALWTDLYDAQSRWAAERGHPPLLAGFGVSLVERALIDAFCKARATTFFEAVADGDFGVRPGEIYDELAGSTPADYLPAAPSRSVAVRHTVGLSDPLTAADVEDPVGDGLPESLAEFVEEDGVRYLKCKIGGDVETDVERLARIASVVDERRDDYGVTLDANEQYETVDALEALWDRLRSRADLGRFVDSVICVEQPLDRSVALGEAAGEMLAEWDGPPIIVDESDGELDSLATALELGYAGTSAKSCKGVFKALVNACLIEHRQATGDGDYLLTAEDLTTVGPVTLPQDLALVATLGVEHVERNGHHYIRGLSGFPEDVQRRVLEAQDDLYRRRDGVAVLSIERGELDLDGVVEAPFGVAAEIDPTRFTPLAEWDPDSLDLT
jgi:L-alanine-DL-glutamate epimerase-like enolase superfamily enzyme